MRVRFSPGTAMLPGVWADGCRVPSLLATTTTVPAYVSGDAGDGAWHDCRAPVEPHGVRMEE